MKKNHDEITIKDSLHLCAKHVWVIVVVAVLGALGAGFASQALTKDTYTSTLTLYSYTDIGSADMNDITVAQQQVKTYEQLFKSKKFLDEIRGALPEEFAAQHPALIRAASININQRSSTEMFDVSVTSTDPEVAFEIAKAISHTASKQIPIFIPNAGEVTVIDEPEVEPQIPNSKHVLRNAFLGAIGGAVVTILCILVYNSFDVIIHDRKKLQDNFDAPILSVIPRHEIEDADGKKQKRTTTFEVHDTDARDAMRLVDDNTPFAISEAFRTFYTNILYLPIQDKCKKIAITSALSGEGKTYVSINLALTIARSDAEHRVLLIDADMRKPRVSHLMNEVKTRSHGLSEYLAGIDEVPNIQQTRISNLSVLSAGSESANATALISSSRFSNLIKTLEEQYNYIIFDTPPANIVSDANLLADLVNGYVVSTRADYSDINEIGTLIDSIEKVNGTLFGISLTELAPKNYVRKYSRYRRYLKYGKKYSGYEGYNR